MKCHKPGTDQEASVEVSVDGYLCAEYMLPHTSNDDPNVIKSFISVSDGEKITLKLNFRGTIHAGSIDILADGSFLADKRIEDKDTRLMRHRSDVLKVFDTVKADATNEFKEQIVECDLHVTPLHRPLPKESGSKFGVGSLAVIISVGQYEHDRYDVKPPYPSTYCGDWPSRPDGPHGGIPPTHELAATVTDGKVNRNRQTKHLRHFKEIRMGKQPWATFIFYYRSRAAIESAKCILKPDRNYPLQSRVVDLDTRDSIEGGAAAGQAYQRAASENGGERPALMPPPPVPEKKKKLFGQPLFPPGTKVTHPDNPLPSSDADPYLSSPTARSATPSLLAGVGSAQPYATPRPPSVLSQKRSISVAGTSREGLPNKEPRMSDRKAALLVAIEEKAKRNEAAKKRLQELEEKEKRREEEERKLEAQEAAEIAELERQEAEMDEEFEELGEEAEKFLEHFE